MRKLRVDQEQDREGGRRDRAPRDLPPPRAAGLLLALDRLGLPGTVRVAIRLRGHDIAVVVHVRPGGPAANSRRNRRPDRRLV